MYVNIILLKKIHNLNIFRKWECLPWAVIKILQANVLPTLYFAVAPATIYPKLYTQSKISTKLQHWTTHGYNSFFFLRKPHLLLLKSVFPFHFKLLIHILTACVGFTHLGPWAVDFSSQNLKFKLLARPELVVMIV